MLKRIGRWLWQLTLAVGFLAAILYLLAAIILERVTYAQ